MTPVSCRLSAIASGVLMLAFASSASANCDPAIARLKPDERILLTTKPAPPVTGDNEFTVTVRDAGCEPVIGATVVIELVMPAMPSMGMPEMRNKITLGAAKDPKAAAAGVYEGRGQVMMAGRWTVNVTATAGGKRIAARTVPFAAK